MQMVLSEHCTNLSAGSTLGVQSNKKYWMAVSTTWNNMTAFSIEYWNI